MNANVKIRCERTMDPIPKVEQYNTVLGVSLLENLHHGR
jgi:hypothetical protein